jgi:FkbM family methyltransferase
MPASLSSGSALKQVAREWRVGVKRLIGVEPRVRETLHPRLERHGSPENGWMIVADSLSRESVVVDVGLGEDVSFSESIISRYGCPVAGLDPTPRAIDYVTSLGNDRLRLYRLGLGAAAGRATLFLPANANHVSGALRHEAHLRGEGVDVEVVTVAQLFSLLGCRRIDLLKLDIEGAEFDVIESAEFRDHASGIDQLCVEFHHRWKGRGKQCTVRAVETLRSCGFECAWYSRSTNEEFTFVRRNAVPRETASQPSPSRAAR